MERNISTGMIVTWILLFFFLMHDKVKKTKCMKYQSFLRALKHRRNEVYEIYVCF